MDICWQKERTLCFEAPWAGGRALGAGTRCQRSVFDVRVLILCRQVFCPSLFAFQLYAVFYNLGTLNVSILKYVIFFFLASGSPVLLKKSFSS